MHCPPPPRPLFSLDFANQTPSDSTVCAPQEEDSFLIKMMHRYGFGAWDRIRAEIHQSRQFRFDWFLKSRSAKEIQSRADQIIRFIEKEMDDLEQVAAGGGVQKKKKAKLG